MEKSLDELKAVGMVTKKAMERQLELELQEWSPGLKLVNYFLIHLLL